MASPTKAEAFTQLGHAANLAQFLWDTGQNNGTNLIGLIDSYEQALEGNFNAEVVSALDQLKTQYEGLISLTAQMMRAHIDDIARLYNLTEFDLASQLFELREAMVTATETIAERNVTRDTSSSGSTTGTGDVWRCGVDKEGLTIESGFAQQVRYECVGDKNTDGVESGAEEFEVYGVGSVSLSPIQIGTASPLRTTVTAVKSQDSMILNASFNSHTGTGASTSAINNWTAETGSFGTEILVQSGAAGADAEAGEVFRVQPGQTTGAMVELTAGACNLQQKISTAGASINPDLPVLFLVRYYWPTAATATLQARLGTQTATISDATSTKDSWTTWDPFSFQTSKNVYYKNFIEDDVRVEIGLSAYTDDSVFIDDLIILQPEVFDGIPHAVVAGSTDWAVGDTKDFTDTTADDGEIQYWIARHFGEYLNHTSGAETFSDV